MASISSIPSLTSSAASFSGLKFPSDELHYLRSRVNFRPIRVSAGSANSTAERTSSSSRIASPGSLYEVLGIENGASFGEIKSAYRKLARVLHPDVAAEDQKENRAYEFMKIQEAYETLSDPEKRSEYDRSLFREARPMSSSPYMKSASVATVASYAAASGFFRSPRRGWETDQCW
ncbi:chaperone protein dnaJ 11, chloroplastic-like [Euphorbia lathyris]|uniref:chaperone protein dnaJ 11, chloroplastic-like n=1 Tax=Euphorbia lathyris TaxID=212925 RepID=UPI00331341C2